MPISSVQCEGLNNRINKKFILALNVFPFLSSLLCGYSQSDLISTQLREEMTFFSSLSIMGTNKVITVYQLGVITKFFGGTLLYYLH